MRTHWNKYITSSLVVFLLIALISSAHALWPFNGRKSLQGIVSYKTTNHFVLLTKQGVNNNPTRVFLPSKTPFPPGVNIGSKVRVTVKPSPQKQQWELVKVEEIFTSPTHSYKPKK